MGIIDLLNKEITQQELLNYYNACITYTTLPPKINGCVFQYKGIYNIFIEKNLSYYKKKKTILHELAHIELNQLSQSNNDLFAFQIDKFEDDADNYIKFLLESRTNYDWCYNIYYNIISSIISDLYFKKQKKNKNF